MFIKYLNTSKQQKIYIWKSLVQMKKNSIIKEKCRQANQATRSPDNLMKWSCGT